VGCVKLSNLYKDIGIVIEYYKLLMLKQLFYLSQDTELCPFLIIQRLFCKIVKMNTAVCFLKPYMKKISWFGKCLLYSVDIYINMFFVV